jgi:hypothetical protein
MLEGLRATPRRAVVLCAERASRLKSGVQGRQPRRAVSGRAAAVARLDL